MLNKFLLIIVFCGLLSAQDIKQIESNATFPKTINQAVDKLLEQIQIQQKALIKDMRKSDLILLHHGLGTWIRNNFGLWSGNEPLMKECGDSLNQKSIHPDDASMVIIEEFWRRLQTEKLEYNFPAPISIDSVSFERAGLKFDCDSSLSEVVKRIKYPDALMEAGIDYTMHFTVSILPNGFIDSIALAEKKPFVAYGDAVQDALKNYRFECVDKAVKHEKVYLRFSISFSSLGARYKKYRATGNEGY